MELFTFQPSLIFILDDGVLRILIQPHFSSQSETFWQHNKTPASIYKLARFLPDEIN